MRRFGRGVKKSLKLDHQQKLLIARPSAAAQPHKGKPSLLAFQFVCGPALSPNRKQNGRQQPEGRDHNKQPKQTFVPF